VPKAFAALTVGDNQDAKLFIDTRTSNHMTRNEGNIFKL